MPGFELGLDLFDRLIQGRIKEYSTGFRKGELEALLSELGKMRVHVFFRVNIRAVFEAGSIADMASVSNLFFI